MIQLFHVSKRYDEYHRALVDVSFRIDTGELVFLTGPSGAGKSTLLRLLYREELPTEGQILVGGRNIVALPASQIPYLRRTMGIVFQDFRLVGRMTVLENLLFVHRALGQDGREARRRSFAALKEVGLAHRTASYPHQLSGGEQQRLAIARAISGDPAILVADEPTGNLDPDLAFEVMQLFAEIHSRGTTVLVATHDRELVARFGRRVVHLERGQLAEVPAPRHPWEQRRDPTLPAFLSPHEGGGE
jgi:cell division transport system ATP-binding protein